MPVFLSSTSARAAETNQHRPGGLNNRSRCSHDSEGWTSEIITLAGLDFPRPLSLACRSLLPVSSPGGFSVCTHIFDVSPSFYKDASHIRFRSLLMTSFSLNYLCKGPLSH